jgi:hypothetical protein
MLVTFSCPAYADITMFGDVATRLLKLMGHSATVPSALAAEDVQPALERLQAAIEVEGDEPSPEAKHAAQEEGGEPVVTLSQRAWPVIELLRAAAKAKCHVMWESNN